LNAESSVDLVRLNVGTADLGGIGRSVGAFLAGSGACSVCGAGGTGGREVSIFSVFAFCPDNLRLLTEAASLVAVEGRGVTSAVSIVCDACDSGTGGNAGKAPDGAGTGGGECTGGGLDAGCITSATVESDVPPVVLCEDTELLYVLPEKPLESDCRGNDDFVWRPKSKPSSMYSLVISSSRRSSSSASSLKLISALSRTCGNASFRTCVSL
jgi:hypothetical protein